MRCASICNWYSHSHRTNEHFVIVGQFSFITFLLSSVIISDTNGCCIKKRRRFFGLLILFVSQCKSKKDFTHFLWWWNNKYNSMSWHETVVLWRLTHPSIVYVLFAYSDLHYFVRFKRVKNRKMNKHLCNIRWTDWCFSLDFFLSGLLSTNYWRKKIHW